ncbi:tetratricopeptide repeat protein [Herbiconiux daphne]|uniref:Tetratricopeptide repeat protein n=1 Tax=Herbiconiux daphne TaxID=2970914 RepID=A0ABT2H8E4_9MICO|nr:hypothetical protein [Herbiconiux daphne]MCS5736206.1 hypothetical protein [Herbiconiux daphne]
MTEPEDDKERPRRAHASRPARSDSGKRPFEPRRDNSSRPDRGARPERGGRPERGSRPASGDRPSRGGPNERRLWTKDGKPARNDKAASAYERPPLTEEELRARELRAVRTRHDDPLIPEEVVPRDLDKVARNELKTLNKENADEVARHLVMAARLIDDDPELAHQHAISASRRAGRIGVVRETLAITAYRTGDFALALRELRTFRRISGSNEQLALMIDSERGLGRPDRALETGRSVERSTLSVPSQVEVAIAMSGARLDLGQPDAALTELEIPQLNPDVAFSYSPDLFHAYAEVLTELGLHDEAAEWRRRADRAELALNGDDDTIEVFEEDDDESVPSEDD